MGRRWVCEGAHRAGSRENVKDSKDGKEGVMRVAHMAGREDNVRGS